MCMCVCTCVERAETALLVWLNAQMSATSVHAHVCVSVHMCLCVYVCLNQLIFSMRCISGTQGCQPTLYIAACLSCHSEDKQCNMALLKTIDD